MKNSISLLLLSVLSACAFTPINEKGLNVKVARDASDIDPVVYIEDGSRTCSVITPVSDPTGDCLSKMRNEAGELGLEYLLIESMERTLCVSQKSNETKSCARVSARTFRRRQGM